MGYYYYYYYYCYYYNEPYSRHAVQGKHIQGLVWANAANNKMAFVGFRSPQKSPKSFSPNRLHAHLGQKRNQLLVRGEGQFSHSLVVNSVVSFLCEAMAR